MNSFSIIYHRNLMRKRVIYSPRGLVNTKCFGCAGLKALGKMPTRGQHLFMPCCGNAGTWALEKSVSGVIFEWKELNKHRGLVSQLSLIILTQSQREYPKAVQKCRAEVLVFIGDLKEAGWQWVPQHEEVRRRGDFAKPCLPRRPTVLWMHTRLG